MSLMIIYGCFMSVRLIDHLEQTDGNHFKRKREDLRVFIAYLQLFFAHYLTEREAVM